MRHVIIIMIIMASNFSFGQPSGVYNGDITEHCANYSLPTACGTAFDCIYNWHPVSRYAVYDGSSQIRLRNGASSSRRTESGVTVGYIFEPNKTYVVDSRFKLTSSATGISVRFHVYASKHRHYFNVISGDCKQEPHLVDPENDTYIGIFESFNSTDWGNIEMQFTCPAADYRYIWVFPEWNSTTSGDVVMDLDYVKVRQCGRGTLDIANQSLPEWLYAKEIINLRENITWPSFSKRTFLGQEIYLLPGFATPDIYSGDGIEITAVSTCNLPIQDPVVGKPGREDEPLGISQIHDENTEVYPNPTVNHSFNTKNTLSEMLLYEFYDMNGRCIDKGKVEPGKTTKHNYQKYASGIYYLKLQNSHRTKIEKIALY